MGHDHVRGTQAGAARRAVSPWRTRGVGGAAGVVALGTTGLLAAVGPGPAASLRSLLAPTPGSTPDALVAAAVAVLAWAVAVWLSTAVLLTVLGRLPGTVGRGCDAVARRVTPAVVRRLVGAALGVVLTTGAVAGTAGPATATPAPVSGSTSTPRTVLDPSALPDLDRPSPEPVSARGRHRGGEATATLDPAALVPLLERDPAPDPVVAPAPAVVAPDAGTDGSTPSGPPGVTDVPDLDRPATDRPATDGTALGLTAGRDTGPTDEVVVVRGDTLWDVARRHLPAGAGDAEISAAWRRWWQANREVVGPDPDVLRPGQVLTPPPRAV